MITLSTVFTQTMEDDKHNRITDINAGLKTHYPQMINSVTHNTDTALYYLMTEQTQGQPDAAALSLYGSEDYWYWVLVSNFIDNPFEEFKQGWVYTKYEDAVMSEAQVSALSSKKESRYGSTVTLN